MGLLVGIYTIYILTRLYIKKWGKKEYIILISDIGVFHTEKIALNCISIIRVYLGNIEQCTLEYMYSTNPTHVKCKSYTYTVQILYMYSTNYRYKVEDMYQIFILYKIKVI